MLRNPNKPLNNSARDSLGVEGRGDCSHWCQRTWRGSHPSQDSGHLSLSARPASGDGQPIRGAGNPSQNGHSVIFSLWGSLSSPEPTRIFFFQVKLPPFSLTETWCFSCRKRSQCQIIRKAQVKSKNQFSPHHLHIYFYDFGIFHIYTENVWIHIYMYHKNNTIFAFL